MAETGTGIGLLGEALLQVPRVLGLHQLCTQKRIKSRTLGYTTNKGLKVGSLLHSLTNGKEKKQKPSWNGSLGLFQHLGG